MRTGQIPQVTYVVLNWNQAEMTADCLNSLARQDYANFRVIVVDNGSKDGSAAVLRERFPWAILIEIPENVGYDLANNVGIDLAMEHGTDYVFLLNNDTEVDARMLSCLIEAAESDPHIGIVGPTVYFFDPPNTVASAGGVIDWRRGEARQLQMGRVDGVPSREETMPAALRAPGQPGADEVMQEVDYVISCAVCAKREAVGRIGGLDPRFFIMKDDVDWCVRAARAGFRTVHVPSARMWHKTSATMGAGSPATTYYMTRNAFLFFWKHLGIWRGLSPTLWNLYRVMRTTAAWSLKGEYRHLRRQRNALILAVRDAFLGRTGAMGPDVQRICYPNL